MQPAVVAQQLYSFSAIGVQGLLFYLVAQVQPERRKTAAGLQLFSGFKQGTAAAGTGVGAGGQVVSGNYSRLFVQHKMGILPIVLSNIMPAAPEKRVAGRKSFKTPYRFSFIAAGYGLSCYLLIHHSFLVPVVTFRPAYAYYLLHLNNYL